MISRAPQFSENIPHIDVSVCIPTYNAGIYFSETLASVEAQDFQGNVEVIISDDASTDDTLDTARSFASRSRYSYKILNHTRQGVGANWDNSISAAQGTYVKLLMQDDILYPQNLSRLFSVMETDGRIGLAFSKRDIISSGADYTKWIDQYGNLHRGWYQDLTKGPVSGRSLLRDRNFLSFPGNKIGEPSVLLLRRSAITKTGNFSRDLKQALDCEYWYRMLVNHDAFFVDEYLAAFRRHEGQLTVQNSKSAYREEGAAQMLLYRSYARHLFSHLSRRNQIRLYLKILKLKIRSGVGA